MLTFLCLIGTGVFENGLETDVEETVCEKREILTEDDRSVEDDSLFLTDPDRIVSKDEDHLTNGKVISSYDFFVFYFFTGKYESPKSTRPFPDGCAIFPTLSLKRFACLAQSHVWFSREIEFKYEREEVWHFERAPTVYVSNQVTGHNK